MFKFLNFLKKKDFKLLPVVNNEYYVYKGYSLKFEFEVDMPDINESEDIVIYGWVIDQLFVSRSGKESWSNHWNHKIYNSKESAMDALNQCIKVSPSLQSRILPLYKFKNNAWRNYIINKIVKDENNDIY